MKKLIPIICCLIILLVVININPITNKIASIITSNPRLIKGPANEYKKDYDFLYVQASSDYTPYSYQDLMNIFYSTINNGWKTFTFYCPSEYTSCVDDVISISNNSILLTHLNNYVHPYNNFTNIKTSTTSSGEITLNIEYLYTQEEIALINKEVDSIIKEVVNTSDDEAKKIKSIHDYLVNNTKYDVKRNETGKSEYDSYKATGTLLSHLATCNGYTDTMAIFLSKLGIKNYKIATTPDDISYESTGHVWNAVYVNDKWLHLDLTWDDPVSEDGQDYLYHKYLLVNNEELKKADDGDVKIEEHNFNKAIYLEFK